MRPLGAKKIAAEQEVFVPAYEKALTSAYPVAADGSALMPFPRVYFVVKV